jgi:hypothetical protein
MPRDTPPPLVVPRGVVAVDCRQPGCVPTPSGPPVASPGAAVALWRSGMTVGFAPRPRGRLQAPAGRA